MKRAARIAVGAAFFVGGMAVTLATYASPDHSGEGRYFLATGAIVAGLVTLARGLSPRA